MSPVKTTNSGVVLYLSKFSAAVLSCSNNETKPYLAYLVPFDIQHIASVPNTRVTLMSSRAPIASRAFDSLPKFCLSGDGS